MSSYHAQGHVDQHWNVAVGCGPELQSVVGDCEGAFLLLSKKEDFVCRYSLSKPTKTIVSAMNTSLPLYGQM